MLLPNDCKVGISDCVFAGTRNEICALFLANLLAKWKYGVIWPIAYYGHILICKTPFLRCQRKKIWQNSMTELLEENFV